MYSDGGYSSSDSDYIVEHFVQPKIVRKTVNDDSADLLGNFDEAKRQAIIDGTYVNRNNELLDQSSNNGDEDEDDDDGDEVYDFSDAGEKESPLQEVSNENLNDTMANDSDSDDESKQNDSNELKTNLTKEQLAALLRGTSKTNHYVLYVTNLNFDTTKEDIQNYFTTNTGHTVKSVRIPKKRRGGYAFVEMSDIDGFQKGFQLHNTELHERKIKIQLSEGGKKKSANKKNILKQKNRKLAEMRNEQKTFTKSGKFYDKTLKKEKAKDILARKRWRKKPKPTSSSK